MPDDAATMPHRERLKVFSGAPIPSSQTCVRTRPHPCEPDPRPPPSACPRPHPPSTSNATRAFAVDVKLTLTVARRAQSPRARAGDPPPRVRFKLFSHLSVVVCSADPFSSLLTSRDHQEIANYLGMDLGDRVIKKFADGEVYVQIQESIRGCDVFSCSPRALPASTTTPWSSSS